MRMGGCYSVDGAMCCLEFEKRLRLRDSAGEGHEYRKWTPQYCTVRWNEGCSPRSMTEHPGTTMNEPPSYLHHQGTWAHRLRRSRDIERKVAHDVGRASECISGNCLSRWISTIIIIFWIDPFVIPNAITPACQKKFKRYREA